MKTSVCLTTVGVALAASAANAQALELREFYVDVSAGVALQQDLRIKSDVMTSGGKINFDPGFRGTMAFGCHLSDTWSVEVETGIGWNYVQTILGDRPSTSSSLYQIPFLANAVYRIPLKNAGIPYVGAGVGGVVSMVDLSTPLGDVGDNDLTFAYQAFAGWNFALSPKWELGVIYKFLGSPDHDWTERGLTFKTGGSFNHSVMVNVNWKF